MDFLCIFKNFKFFANFMHHKNWILLARDENFNSLARRERTVFLEILRYLKKFSALFYTKFLNFLIFSYSSGIPYLNTFEKPDPPERSQPPINRSNYPVPTNSYRSSHFEYEQQNRHTPTGGSPIVTNITNTSTSFNTSSFPTGKPIGEVHPMPAPRINSLPPSVSPPDTLKKQPPPVPKKPARLRRKFETVIGNDGESENCAQVGNFRKN